MGIANISCEFDGQSVSELLMPVTNMRKLNCATAGRERSCSLASHQVKCCLPKTQTGKIFFRFGQLKK